MRAGRVPARKSRYSGKVWKPHWMPACMAFRDMPSTLTRVRRVVSRCSGRHGAMAKPQLPITVVVTPCQMLLVA